VSIAQACAEEKKGGKKEGKKGEHISPVSQEARKERSLLGSTCHRERTEGGAVLSAEPSPLNVAG